jgi:hypothetical protein
MVEHESEITPADHAGGTSTSHTIMIDSLAALLEALPATAPHKAYRAAAIDENLLGKEADGARKRSFRYLRELYLLDPEDLLFRALRDLWPVDPEARPLLAGLSALAHDPVFRASSAAILDAAPGDAVSSHDLELAVEAQFPGNYNEGTRAKIGRNTSSSWEQAGHLESVKRNEKVRKRATCKPADVAYALMLGHIEGARGQLLFDTVWAKVLDHPRSHLFDLASVANQQGLIEFRHSGGVVEVGFRELMRPIEGQLL